VAAPEFPGSFVIDRTRSLGFGSGPWSREKLVEAWGAPTADKFITEAKAAGWLVSPRRGEYHVPPAQDLMLVSWLPEPQRTEFLISRTLASEKIRAWCLSAWCRDKGLALPEAVFVTDLSRTSEPPRSKMDMGQLRATAPSLVTARGNIQYLDNLLIVPAMPETGQVIPRVSLVPESEQVVSRRKQENDIGTAAMGVAALLALAFTGDMPNEVTLATMALKTREARMRGIPFAVDGAMADEAFVTALLASIGTSRVEELVLKELKPSSKQQAQLIQQWAATFGPPQLVTNWKDTLQDGPFPYMLVPPSLWSEMGADQAARRYRALQKLARA
jgi:hypothetical protein